MITVRAGSGAIAVCLLLLASGCSREQQDWRSAEAADTIEGYAQFIQRHPESELATQARTRVAQLGEDRDWQHAGSADTVAAYRDFIAQHPDGKWAREAQIRLENFSLGEQTGTDAASRAAAGAARASGEASGSAASTGSATVRTDVAGDPGAPGKAAPAHFGIQLGAFSTEAGANNEWRLLATRFAPDLQGLQEHVVPTDTASGRIYRLQAAVGDEGRARSICDSLRKHGQGCVAVLPH